MLLALIAIGAAALHLTGALNHDVAWILISAKMVAAGAEIGRDIVDVNPPLPWWIAASVVRAGAMAGLDAGSAFVLFTIMCVLVAVMLSARLLALNGELAARSRTLLLYAAAVLLFSPGYDFAQREHFLLIAALPWLLSCAVAARGATPARGLRIMVGLFAASGFCLKPHFLLLPLTSELWLAWRSGRIKLRLEALTLGACGAAYVAAVILWAPHYLDEVLPAALGSYGAYESPAAAVIYAILAAILPFLLSATLLPRQADAADRYAEIVLVGAGAALLIALLQMKGWPYHLLPTSGLASIGCASIALRQSADRSILLWSAWLLIILASFGSGVAYLRATVSPEPSGSQRLQAVLERNVPPGGKVLALITSPRDVHPAVLASGRSWILPFWGMHLLPASIAPTSDPIARARAFNQIQQVAAAIRREQPDLIFIDERREKLGLPPDFDYLSVLSKWPEFRAALSRYRRESQVAGFRILRRAMPASDEAHP